MAKPRKTENPDTVMEWMNQDMDDETSSGLGNDESSETYPEGVGGGFTNSPLVSYTRMSPYKNSPRNQPITKIIIHHMAGVASVESFGEIVTRPGRNMSANYAIGNDGRIGLYCDEEDRCWCSSSAWADNRGIAIEVSNSKLGEPWPISKKAWDSMINLCADICKRNNIPKLVYTGDKNGSLCFHRFFAATGCVPINTTEVLTPEGWVPVRDIKIGDKIATVSPKDFSIHFDAVENMTPVHKDTVFTTNGMSVTREHRVLYSDTQKAGFHIDEYQKICDHPFGVPSAGSSKAKGMDIKSSEMIFLLEMQRVGSYDEENQILEFRYIMESKVQYFHGLLKNLGYEYEKTQEDLGPVSFRVTDKRAWDLCKKYLSGKDFNWKWLEMNATQFSYFIYKSASHVDTSWSRKYISDSIVNIDIVQALCAINERGSHYVESENALYVDDNAYRTINPGKSTVTTDDVDVACVTTKTGCFLMRQNGVTTITGNCPGTYIFTRAQQICDEVNAKLGAPSQTTPTEKPNTEPTTSTSVFVGALVSLASNAVYYNGKSIPQWVLNQRWYVDEVKGDRAVINRNESGNSAINSPINVKYLTVISNAAAPAKSTYPKLMRLEKNHAIYDRSGNVKSHIEKTALYTLVSELIINGKTYAQLKSGAGYILLSDAPIVRDNTINVGDRVKPLSNTTYDGDKFVIYADSYTVLRINGDRVVISSDGKNATAAVKASNLQKI